MTTTIWKFVVPVEDEVSLDLPEGAEILCFSTQFGQPCLWAKVNSLASKVPRRFRMFGTGHPIPDTIGPYVGTCQLAGGRLVFHLFEVV